MKIIIDYDHLHNRLVPSNKKLVMLFPKISWAIWENYLVLDVVKTSFFQNIQKGKLRKTIIGSSIYSFWHENEKIIALHSMKFKRL
jgi:hypothetical protein